VDVRGRRLRGLRHGALGRTDRSHQRYTGAARHFRRRVGRHELHDNAQAPNPAGSASEPRKPRWSDLIVNEVNGKREMDITRVQMLYFTLVTASFV